MASAGSPSNGNNGQQHDDSLDDFSLAPDGEGLDDDLDVDLAAAAELAAEGAEEEAGGGGGAAVDALGTGEMGWAGEGRLVLGRGRECVRTENVTIIVD